MNKENKKDVFLNATTGTTPIEKSNRNYKSNTIKEGTKEKINIKLIGIKLPN